MRTRAFFNVLPLDISKYAVIIVTDDDRKRWCLLMDDTKRITALTGGKSEV